MKKLCWCSSVAAVLIIGMAWCPWPGSKYLSAVLAAAILGLNLAGCFCCKGKCSPDSEQT